MTNAGAIRAGRAFVELFGDDSKLVRVLKSSEAQLRAWGNRVSGFGRQIAMASAAALAPLVMATRSFASLDDEMRIVKAVTGATADEFERLYEIAKRLGRTTSFKAVEVAGGQRELGRAGFKPAEIEASIEGVLNLARATGTELPEAAGIAAGTLRAFSLEADQMNRVVDVLVATANNSAQTLTDLGESMKYAAPIADEYGVSLEDTAKALGVLANMQIKGSMAGTSLRQIMLRLSDPAIRKRLQDMDVDLSNIGDTMIGIGRAMAKMSRPERLAFAKEFFDQRAAAAVVKLAKSDFPALSQAIDNAGGTAARTAEEMDAGIGGVLRRLWSAAEGATNALAEALEPSITELGETVTEILGPVTTWIENNRELVTLLAKVTAGTLALGMALLALGGAAKVVAALNVALAFLAANPLVAAATAGAALALAISRMSAACQAATKAIIGMTAAWAIFTANPVLLVFAATAAAAIYLSDALSDTEEKFADLSHAAERARSAGDKQREAALRQVRELEKLAAKERLNNDQMKRAETLIESLESRYGDLSVSVDRATGRIVGLTKAHADLNEQMRQTAIQDIEREIKQRTGNLERLAREQQEEHSDVAIVMMRQQADQELAAIRQAMSRLRMLRQEGATPEALTGKPGLPGGVPGPASGEEDERVYEETVAHEMERIRLGMIENRHRRELALIEEKYRHEMALAILAGKEKEKVDDMERKRDLELAAARKRHAKENAEESKQQADDVADREKALRWEIQRLEVEKTMTGRAREKALLKIEEERALEEARAAGIDPGLVRRKYALMGRDIMGQTRERFSVTGTFNALVAGRMAAGGPAERTAKATEETAGHLKYIRRKFEFTGPKTSKFT